MNHLAHCALAHVAGPDSAGLVVGGCVGDFVKGPLRGALPPDIELGVRLHRAIDAWTARDEDMARSVARFDPALRRVAPILLDIAADHLLARRFPQHHAQPLRVFTRQVYRTLEHAAPNLPPEARMHVERICEHDALAAYAGTRVVVRGFDRVLTRLGRSHLLAQAVDDLHDRLDAFDEDFSRYYPRLCDAAARWLSAERGSS